MEHLFKKWKKIKGIINGSEGIFLLLDYDGTLTSIVDKPAFAKLPTDTKNILKKLKKNPFFKLAIISGRPLGEIKRLVGIENIIYAGNHGLELEGPDIKFVNDKALSAQKFLNRLYKKLQNELSGIKGAFVENKGLSLSIHFRLVNKKDVMKIKTILDNVLRPWVINRRIRLTHGKMVYEIRPPVKWDKGKIVRWLLARHGIIKSKPLPICVGDDQTDEDMFRAIGKRGISVCVGKANPFSRAGYYLKSTEEVKRFLNRLDNLAE